MPIIAGLAAALTFSKPDHLSDNTGYDERLAMPSMA